MSGASAVNLEAPVTDDAGRYAQRRKRQRRRRLLIVATNPCEGASTRVRMLQFVPAWERMGYECDFQPFFDSATAAWLYEGGHLLRKMRVVLSGILRRTGALRSAAGRNTALLIHRELYPLGLTWELARLRRRGVRVIYDLDDAMFLPQRRGRGLLSQLERPDSTAEVIGFSDWVVAGNQFLADYAARIHPRVTVIPTVVDTDRIVARPYDATSSRDPVIGWIGSHTTTKYLQLLEPVLARLACRHRFRLLVVGAGGPLPFDGFPVEERRWELLREWEAFTSCDIGIYPLSDDAWTQGKCGFKAIQFMAAGVPVVAARVGVNCEIVEDGVNGLLAGDEEEWTDRLERLLTDAGLRARLGAAGRRTIEERYSLRVAAARWARVLDAVCRE